MNSHLYILHCARIKLIANYLPRADVIVDLGGAGSPLYQLGYPHPFKKMTIVDLPSDERDVQYREIAITPDIAIDDGEISVRYGSMVDLDDFADGSVDLVWSGQSIEHVDRDDGAKMCRNVFRILKNGGSFCLDTPNRYITELHTKPVGGGFINPDHKVEYYTEELSSLLKHAGFNIRSSLGLCHMPSAKESFFYSDFILGEPVSSDVKRSYVQYYHCTK
jgi:SAM-dependent methyltransferase